LITTYQHVKIARYAPTSYPHQQGLTCGETNVKGMLDAFRIPYQAPESRRMHERIFGLAFMEDISARLCNHGLKAPIRHASNFSDDERLKTIKSHIDKDEPVLLAIGNGHLNRETFSSSARVFIGHFITVYGYDPEREIFYIYDSYLKGSFREEIPIGNEVRTFVEFLRDWEGPFYYRFISMDHVYIPVSTS